MELKITSGIPKWYFIVKKPLWNLHRETLTVNYLTFSTNYYYKICFTFFSFLATKGGGIRFYLLGPYMGGECVLGVFPRLFRFITLHIWPIAQFSVQDHSLNWDFHLHSYLNKRENGEIPFGFTCVSIFSQSIWT